MDYAGFFINLDRSAQRATEMQAHLASLGLTERYRRFPAAEGNTLNLPHSKTLPGEVGCFISHYLLLKENLDRTIPLHIVEDDIVFSRFAESVIQSLLANKTFETYDIVHLDTFVLNSTVLYKKYLQLYRENVRRGAGGEVESANFQLIDMKGIEFASTASMVVAPHAIGKLHDLYAEELARGPETPIDLFIRRKAQEGVIRVGCIFPFVTSLRLEHVMSTTLSEKEKPLFTLASVLARHAFFVEADWNKCLEYANRYLTAPAGDLQRQVLTHILGFSLDDRFRFG